MTISRPSARRLAWGGFLLLTGWVAPGCARMEESSAFERDLTALEAEIAAMNGADAPPPVGVEAARRVDRLLARAFLTGEYGHYRAAEEALTAAAQEGENPFWLYSYRVQLNLRLHRLGRVREDLPHLAGSAREDTVAGELALQDGRYAAAEAALVRAAEERGTWANLARLAHFRANTGRSEEAEELYDRARADLTAKQMRHFAWLELQKGVLDWEQGRAEAALEHYRRADREYSGYWLIEEHLAEALLALGSEAEARRLYRQLVARTADPAFIWVLAGLVGPTEAKSLAERAEALGRERMALFPEAAVGHRVESLLASDPAGPEALELAIWNHRLRPNVDSKVLLARAHLAAGDEERAREILEQIHRSPWRNRQVAELAASLGTPPPDR